MIPKSPFRFALGVVSTMAAAFVALPIVVLVVSSFTDGGFVSFPPKGGWGVRWFDEAIHADNYVAAFTLSVRVAAVTAVVATVAGFGVGRYLGQASPGVRSRVMTVLSAPILLSTFLIAIGSLQMYAVLGVPRTFVTLVIGHLAICMPYAARTMSVAFLTHEWRLEQAAASLGAGPLRTMWSVVLPSLRAPIIATIAFAALLSFDDVVVSLFLASPGLQTLPVLIFSDVEQSLSPLVIAASTLIVAISAVLVITLERSLGLVTAFAGKSALSERS
jgi:putative spermidine/putrescine transport system permease protein